MRFHHVNMAFLCGVLLVKIDMVRDNHLHVLRSEVAALMIPRALLH